MGEDAATPAPLVAVVVRTKDRPLFLSRALGSISAQTFGDYEVVIVNDGGDPQAVEQVLAAQPATLRDRTSVIHNPSATGRWPAANAGVTASTAPLLTLHDDDDSWHPDFLTETVAYLQAHPDDHAALVRTEVVHERWEGDTAVRTGGYLLEEHNPEVLLSDLLDFNRFVPISFLYRRSLHDRLGLYDASLPAAADWAFNLQILQLGPVPYASDRVLAYWNQRLEERGVLGNSVFAAPRDHWIADGRHRDEALRAFVDQYGTGLPLYLSRVTEKRHRKIRGEISDAVQSIDRTVREGLDGVAEEQRISREQSDARIDALEATIGELRAHLDRTMDARIRGFVWRRKQWVRGLRRRGDGDR